MLYPDQFWQVEAARRDGFPVAQIARHHFPDRLAGIGVSGAPGGEADDACAKAGIRAIADTISY